MGIRILLLARSNRVCWSCFNSGLSGALMAFTESLCRLASRSIVNTLAMNTPIATAAIRSTKTVNAITPYMIQAALIAFLELYDWQIEAIRVGIADADAGRVVDHEAVVAWLESWDTENELPAPRCG